MKDTGHFNREHLDQTGKTCDHRHDIFLASNSLFEVAHLFNVRTSVSNNFLGNFMKINNIFR